MELWVVRSLSYVYRELLTTSDNIVLDSLQKERLGAMLDEDPQLMERRTTIAKRLELYKSARDEIDSVAWK
jgi:hypothetical protein